MTKLIFLWFFFFGHIFFLLTESYGVDCLENFICRSAFLRLFTRGIFLSSLVVPFGRLLFLVIHLGLFSRIFFWNQMKKFCSVLIESGDCWFRFFLLLSESMNVLHFIIIFLSLLVSYLFLNPVKLKGCCKNWN